MGHKDKARKRSGGEASSSAASHTLNQIVTKGGQSGIAYLIGRNGHFKAIPATPHANTDDTERINSSLMTENRSQSPDLLTNSQDTASNPEYTYARECFVQEVKQSEPEPVESTANLTGIQFSGIPLRNDDTLNDEDIAPVESKFTPLQDYMSQPPKKEPFNPLKLLHKKTNAEYTLVHRTLESPSVGHSEFIPSLTADLSSRDAESWADAVSYQEHDAVSNRAFPLPLHSPPLAIVPLGNVLEDMGECHEFDEHWLARPEKPRSQNEDEAESEIEEDDASDFMDSLWFSDYSEAIPTLEEEHPLLQIHHGFVLRHLLSEFDAHYRTHSPHSDLRGRNTADAPGRSSTKQEVFEQGQKRARNFDQDSLGESSGDAVRKKSCPVKTKQRCRLWLACPFSKKNPRRYRSCYRNRLTKISYVKQHLSRHHCYPIYCTNCMATFDSEEIRDAHARAHSCEEQPVIQWEAVSEAQKRQLSQRVPRRMSETEQWYTIFEILFPGSPRPKTPFVDGELSEELSSFQDFATSQGPAIITDSLIERGFGISRLVQDEQVTIFNDTILADGLQAIFERYLEARESQVPPEADNIASEPPERSTVGRNGRSSSTTLVEERSLSDSGEHASEKGPADDNIEGLSEHIVDSEDHQDSAQLSDNTRYETPPSDNGQTVPYEADLFQPGVDSLAEDDLFASYLAFPID
ncbi:hypothetical protein LTS17_004811 [Exophiala oligosperma]